MGFLITIAQWFPPVSYSGSTKEGVLLRSVSPSLGLSAHFPGCGILNYRSNRNWSLRVCYFEGAL